MLDEALGFMFSFPEDDSLFGGLGLAAMGMGAVRGMTMGVDITTDEAVLSDCRTPD